MKNNSSICPNCGTAYDHAPGVIVEGPSPTSAEVPNYGTTGHYGGTIDEIKAWHKILTEWAGVPDGKAKRLLIQRAFGLSDKEVTTFFL